MSSESSFKWMALRRLLWAHEPSHGIHLSIDVLHSDLPVWGLLDVVIGAKVRAITFTVLHLIHGALARGFVGTPAKQSCAVSKAPTGEMVVGNLNDYFRSDRFPLAGAVRTPAARSSRRVASESRCFL